MEYVKEAPKCYSKSLEKRGGFAMLKAKDWKYLLRRTVCIIGRAPTPQVIAQSKQSIHFYLISYLEGETWYVDLNLFPTKKISRQHALIAYNFEKLQFEIRNLSKKYRLYVNEIVLTYNDAPHPLNSRDIIHIGKHTLSFLLPLPQ